MVLSTMTRPEAHLFVPLYVLWVIKHKPAAAAAKGITLVAVSLALYHLLRYSYYGYFLPTPAAMKFNGAFQAGLTYLTGFFIHGHYCWAIPFMLFSVASRERRSAALPLQLNYPRL